jgi:hypothetical protein
MARSRSLGSLVVRLGLDAADFSRRLDRFSRSLRNKFKGVEKAFSFALKPLSLLTAGLTSSLSVAGLGIIVKQTQATIDALAKMSDRVGISTEKLGGLRFAAELAGEETADLDRNLVRFAKNVGLAATGNEKLEKSFAKLGITTQELRTLPIDELFFQLADAIAKLPTQTLRVAAAFEVFGQKGIRMVNVLQQGSEGLRAQVEEFAQLNGTVSRLDAAQVELMGDQWQRFGVTIQGVKNDLTVALAPAITGVTNLLIEAQKEGGGFQSKFEQILDLTVAGFEALGLSVGKFINDARAGFARFIAGFVQMIADARKQIENLINATIGGLNKLIGFANTMQTKVFGIPFANPIEELDLTGDIDPLEAFAEGINDVADTFETRSAELERQMGEGGPIFNAWNNLKRRLGLDAKQAIKDAQNTIDDDEIDPSLFGVEDGGGSESKTKAHAEDVREATEAYTSYGPIAVEELQRIQEESENLLQTNRQRFEEEIRGWQALLDQGRITETEFAKLTAISRERTVQLGEEWDTVLNGMTGAFDQFVRAGEFSFETLVNSILADLARLALSDTLKQIFKVIQDGSGDWLGGVVKGASNLFAGFFADGGRARSGRLHVVGEEGPELFVPNSSGVILPNETFAGMAEPRARGINYNQTLHIAPGVSRRELHETLPAVTRATIDAVTSMIERGGRPAKRFVY